MCGTHTFEWNKEVLDLRFWCVLGLLDLGLLLSSSLPDGNAAELRPQDEDPH